VGSVEEFVWFVFSKLHYWFHGTYTEAVATSAWDLFRQLWYFLAVGVALSAFLSVCVRRSQIAVFFQRTGRFSILGAVIIGIISPIGTYVLIPLIATLSAVGVPAPPLIAFLVASPLMNPILFSLTAGAFGYEMAVARTLAALILGVSAGLLADVLISRKHLSGSICNGGSLVGVLGCEEVTNTALVSRIREFVRQLYRTARYASKFFFLAIVVAAIVKELVPATWIIRTLGAGRTFSVVVAVAAGVPLYACGGGTIPVMQVLQELGMDKGAILAFFISGPATKLSTLVALRAAVRKGVFLSYLAITLVGALLLGLLYSHW